jgi:hypothetical protein
MEKRKMKCYYSHCKAIYDTPQEDRDIDLLERLGYEVVNPNMKIHREMCEDFGSGGMDYFIGQVMKCDVLAFRSLPNGEIPAGVWTEIRTALDNIIAIFELPRFYNRTILSVDATRDYLKEVGQR